jgi:hypothetical protein
MVAEKKKDIGVKPGTIFSTDFPDERGYLLRLYTLVLGVDYNLPPKALVQIIARPDFNPQGNLVGTEIIDIHDTTPIIGHRGGENEILISRVDGGYRRAIEDKEKLPEEIKLRARQLLSEIHRR